MNRPDRFEEFTFGAEPCSYAEYIGMDVGPQFAVRVDFALPADEADPVFERLEEFVQESWEYDEPQLLPELYIAPNEPTEGQALVTLRWRKLGVGRPSLALELVRLYLGVYYYELLGTRAPVKIVVCPDPEEPDFADRRTLNALGLA